MASAKRRIYDGEALTPAQHRALQDKLGRPVCWPLHPPEMLDLQRTERHYRSAETTFNGDMIHSPQRM